MRIDLTGRSAVVTGSGQGIGLAIAKGLATAGASVVLNARSEERLAWAATQIKEVAPEAAVRVVAADLSTPAGVQRLLEEASTTDVLVNNLGIFDPRAFFDITDDDWDRFFQVNVMSGIRLSRSYVPGMIDRGWGRVVFISSESALQIPPEMIHYGMTKTAQLSVSRGLAEVCAGTGVTVNAVLPGPTASEGVSDFVAKLDPESGRTPRELVDAFVREHRPTSILRRAATPEEVANMVVYICSPQASATTGAALSVDGGTRRSIV